MNPWKNYPREYRVVAIAGLINIAAYMTIGYIIGVKHAKKK